MSCGTLSKGTEMKMVLEISPKYAKSLRRLEEDCEMYTEQELVDAALEFFIRAVAEVCKGRKIVSMNKENKTYRVLKMQALQNAARKR